MGGNKHWICETMDEKDARELAEDWVKSGGQVREDGPHGGNNTDHLHLFLDNDKNNDVVLNYTRGTGYEGEEDHSGSSDSSSSNDDYDWPDDNSDSSSSDDGGCFITTAVCGSLGKPDNCEELTLFRRFRDTYMQQTVDMRSDIAEYYEVAPKICTAIDALGKQKADKVYGQIWNEMLKPTFNALKKGEMDKTYRLYKGMVMTLKKKYLK